MPNLSVPRLSSFFPLMENVTPGDMRSIDWDTAERMFPGCSARWAEQGNERRASARAIVLYRGMPVVETSGPEMYLWYKDGWVRYDQRHTSDMKAYIKFQRPEGGPSVYVSVTRGPDGRIDAVGVDPAEVSGATPPTRPNGKVTAELRGPAARSKGLADMLTVAGL